MFHVEQKNINFKVPRGTYFMAKRNYLDIQQDILNQIDKNSKNKLVDELMDTLSISSDSAYRRIRLEKTFTLDELIKISNNYNISLDQLITSNSSESVLFSFPFKTNSFNLEEYFLKILNHLRKIKDNKGTMYYSAKDIPIFHFFQNKKLLAFKFHYWLNVMNNDSELISHKFNYDFIPAKLAELTKQIYTIYAQIQTHEIWNLETLTRTSNQITYYYELGLIDESQAIDLQNTLKDFSLHFEKQCEKSNKFFMNETPFNTEENYHFYTNDIIATDNSIYAEYADIKESFLPHIVLNYMTTDNEQYSEFNKSIFTNVIQKSTLISSVNEKDRTKFFSYNRKFIDKQLLKIKVI